MAQKHLTPDEKITQRRIEKLEKKLESAHVDFRKVSEKELEKSINLVVICPDMITPILAAAGLSSQQLSAIQHLIYASGFSYNSIPANEFNVVRESIKIVYDNSISILDKEVKTIKNDYIPTQDNLEPITNN